MESIRDRKLSEIKSIIQKDLSGADLKLSLFVSAAQSFKKNFLLNPFPSSYVEDENKNFDRLVSSLLLVNSVINVLKISVGGPRADSFGGRAFGDADGWN